MPPKKTVPEEEVSLSDLYRLVKGLSDQMATMNAKVEKVDSIESEIRSMKTLIESLTVENRELKAAVKSKDEQLNDMQKHINGVEERLNSLEQHHRGWGARVLNIPLTDEEEADSQLTVKKVFDLALRPIFEGAVTRGKLRAVPEAEQVLEMAHVLPGKPGTHKPIIMRFFSRQLRNLCFQLKRDFAPREQAHGSSS